VFAYFLSYVRGVFNSPVATRHTGEGLLGLSRVFGNDLYMRKRACLLCIFVPPIDVGAGTFLGVRRIFARILPNLLKKRDLQKNLCM